MDIAIIGRTETLFNTINRILEIEDYNIKLIVTAKEAPEYKKTSEDYKNIATKLNIPFINTSLISKKTNVEIIKKHLPIDIAISMNYTNIISQEVIDLFRLGILNAHGGDLPKYRGNACQAWAIINGENKIGLCIHKMEGGELDSGDIIFKEYLYITDNTKITDVYKWMDERIPEMFLTSVNKLKSNPNYILEKQSKRPKDILRCYPRLPEDGRINWYESNINILRLINASTKPYSGAYCFLNNEKLIIWEAELPNDSENYCAIPGQIANINKPKGEVTVTTGKGKLLLRLITYGDFTGKPSEIIKSIRIRLK